MKTRCLCSLQTGNPVLKALFLIILLMFISVLLSQSAHGAQVTLAWDPNKENDLAGYKLYFGVTSGTYTNSINVGNVTQYTITNLDAYTIYYCAVTAYDTSGNESGYSNEMVHVISENHNSKTQQVTDSGSNSGKGGCFIHTIIHPSRNKQLSEMISHIKGI